MSIQASTLHFSWQWNENHFSRSLNYIALVKAKMAKFQLLIEIRVASWYLTNFHKTYVATSMPSR